MYPERLYSFNKESEILAEVNCELNRHFILNNGDSLTGNKLSRNQIDKAVSPEFEHHPKGYLIYTISHYLSRFSDKEDLRIRITNPELFKINLDFQLNSKISEDEFEYDNRRGGYSVTATSIKQNVGIKDEKLTEKEIEVKTKSLLYKFSIEIKHTPIQFNFSHCDIIIKIVENGSEIITEPSTAIKRAAKNYIRTLIHYNHKLILKPHN